MQGQAKSLRLTYVAGDRNSESNKKPVYVLDLEIQTEFVEFQIENRYRVKVNNTQCIVIVYTTRVNFMR